MHPASVLAGWLLTALVLQFLPLVPLSLVALLAGGGLCWREPGALWRSLWRMKWLLLAMLLVLGWGVPGPAVLAHDWAPTWPGLAQGAGQALRVLILVWLVRLLWLAYGQGGVLAGIYALLRPWRCLGMPAERIALRLCLTLACAEQLLAAPPGFCWENWRRELFGVAQAVPDRVELELYRFSRRDAFVAVLLLAGTGILMKVWA